MTTEYIKDKNPEYILNKHSGYETSVLMEHTTILNGLKDTDTMDAYIELQGRLFVGICIRDDPNKFIEDRLTKYCDEEKNKIDLNQRENSQQVKNIHNRAWSRIISDALGVFIKKYKVDGSKSKMAIIDNKTNDGRDVVDIDELPPVEVENEDNNI